MALPNLPTAHIPPAFEKLKATCDHCPQLTALTKYLSKTWVFSTSRPPASWTTFKRSARTMPQVRLYRHQTKVIKSRQEALQELWCQYEQADRMSTSEYLRRCSDLVDISED
ncbi:hypothetical protein NP493_3544g00002 [Ridgeia piscesae]|uniref:Uncharacterized protein n=1 Tax=Ridgeia piscesae TaxID=27915 RepID=A0AAD9MXW2_RIDPI|nr:hypothetical protein NP493_3544g00002 [Ridgeia piscesae]